jgi:proteasome assembly chaperone (PAC2) family protein
VVDPEASKTLVDCLAKIRQLEEENAHLREAAKTFGELAERLKHELDAQLRRLAAADSRRPARDNRSQIDADPAGLVK